MGWRVPRGSRSPLGKEQRDSKRDISPARSFILGRMVRERRE